MENFSLIILLTSLHFTVLVASEHLAYVPTDNITLNCGATSDFIGSDGRFWSGDKSSIFGPFESSHNKSEAYKADTQGESVDEVPYMTARVSTSEFKYTFHVTPGQKFVRLYFHPASYNKFDPSKAFFSVKAGSFTLFKNFSASLVAESLAVSSFFREFCLNIEENQDLDLVFTPSPSAANGSTYAFINGIEIVSMPPNLYHTPPNSTEDDGFPVDNYTALEMVYRLNVGGQSISPMKDTGMFRLWSDDFEYLIFGDNSFIVGDNAPVEYTIIPEYTAPMEVYWTARTMGLNEKHNLSWRLPVDSGFKYMLRLHFCEPQEPINSSGEIEFVVFINANMADPLVDVIMWTNHSKTPFYKDYVLLSSKKGKENSHQDITIDLHPVRAEYDAVILNGIEVFKLNNSDGNLAGSNPELPVAPHPDLEPRKPPIGKSGNIRTVIIDILGPISSLVVILLLLFLIFWIRSIKLATNSATALPSDICRHFSLREIKTATNNFDKSFIIGRGGFGDVYRGFINAGSTPVAIKRLNPCSKQGLREFQTEIEMLSLLRHQNLVSLIGYCKDNKEMILVYDYMVHGTLRNHLYNTDKQPLTWEQRLRICIGAAHGIHYLHTGPNHSIIHRDVKTTNILLDEKWVAKVSDFGLSKMNDMSNTHISTAVKGSVGYLDPQYYRFQRLTEKSDVYSFGVVLCEALCGRAPISQSEDHMQISLAEWAQHCYNNGTLDQTIDPYLQGKISPPSLLKFGEVAISCLASEGNRRPAMSEVVCGLELALQLQDSEVDGNDENQVNDSTLIDYHVLYSSGSGSMKVGR
ncbi:hypothetical protein PTKIN_Ptkin12aG0019900 [Pterospermum kingtungense]